MRRMRRRQWTRMVGVLLAAVSFCVGLNASGTKSRKLQPLPFDPSLSLVVAVEGDFSSFPRQEWRHLVLYPTITAYAPDEPYQELERELPPDLWAERMVQSFSASQLPEGWVFFFPDQGQPLRLHIAIWDEQHRLAQAIVKTWDGTVLGELPANPNGGEITGSLNIPPDLDEWVIEIWSGGGMATMLGRANGKTPKAQTGLIYHTTVGFLPEQGNPTDVSNPLLANYGGNVRTYSHTESLPDNDTREVAFYRPSGIWGTLKTKNYLGIKQDLGKLPPDKDVAAEYQKLVDQFVANFNIPPNRANFALRDAMIPPFSRNVTATWHGFSAWGENLAIIIVPVYDKTRKEWVVVPSLQITGQTRGRASVIWSAQINLRISQEEKTRLQIGDAQPVADLYGLVVSKVNANVRAEGISQPVTVSVQPDRRCAPLVGGVQISNQGVQPDVGIYYLCATHMVNYPRTGGCDVNDGRQHDIRQQQLSPPPSPGSVNAPLIGQGQATVQLFKGFRYKFVPMLEYTAPPCTYEIVPSEKIEDVPDASQVSFDARLNNVAVLKVYVYPPEKPFGVRVELSKRLPDGNWSLLFSVPANYDEKTKAYLASFGDLQLDRQGNGSYRGTYQIKAVIYLPPNQPDSGPRVEERVQVHTFNPSCEVVLSM
jgi:hypothetical protein